MPRFWKRPPSALPLEAEPLLLQTTTQVAMVALAKEADVVAEGEKDQILLQPRRDKGEKKRLVSEALRARDPSLQQIELAVLDYFSKCVVPKNRKRENVKTDQEGKEYSRGLLLGLYTVRGTGISRATSAHADLVRLCHMLARKRPQVMAHRYTSIMVNENPCVAYHRDINNLGPSYLRSLGQYTGGLFHQLDDVSVCGSLPEGSVSAKGTCLSTQGGWIMFDAQIPHGITR
eukprot:5016836-Amphidinium_carterae.1